MDAETGKAISMQREMTSNVARRELKLYQKHV